jgi:hypothetical protein
MESAIGMDNNNIFWSGYSNRERQDTIIKIQHIVSQYGDLVDFRLFSDMAINMKIELQE